VTYGSVLEPAELGSGGGVYGTAAGAGGGALRLTVGGTLRVLAGGVLSANGETATDWRAGGGSGGSLWIQCGALTGEGVITANGGATIPGSSGGGGGGRIAIYTCDQQMNPAHITAIGGAGYHYGQPGTVLFASTAITLTQQPADQIAFVGQPVTLTIVASTTHGGLYFQWRKNHEDLVEDPPHVTGTQTAALQIDAAQLDDQGYYDVWLTDDCGAFVSDAAHLIVPAPGDLNCDGLLNTFDIDPFVLALTNPDAYITAFPDCDRMLADCNGDGLVNAFDIDPFVLLLTGG
jgi:hypothetical protein